MVADALSLRRGGIPLTQRAGLAAAARRTALVRAGVGAALLALLLAAIWLARGADLRAAALVPEGRAAVVALDLSASIDAASKRRVEELLRDLVAADRAAGLVIFSDAAYELLPPGSPARELQPLVRFFAPRPDGTFPPNPWEKEFRAGTRISAGLDVARQALVREAGRGGTLVLVSDLGVPSSDLTRLGGAVAALGREGIRLRIVPLFALPAKRALFERIAGADAFLDERSLAALDAGAAGRPRTAAIRWPFVAVALLLVVILAANERWCGRLQLAAPRAAAEAEAAR